MEAPAVCAGMQSALLRNAASCIAATARSVEQENEIACSANKNYSSRVPLGIEISFSLGASKRPMTVHAKRMRRQTIHNARAPHFSEIQLNLPAS